MDPIQRHKMKLVLYNSKNLGDPTNLIDFIQITLKTDNQVEDLIKEVKSKNNETKAVIQTVIKSWESEKGAKATINAMADIMQLMTFDTEAGKAFPVIFRMKNKCGQHSK